jgi:hypothetical protein
MDKSLDDVIKENPKKFNLNRGKNVKRTNVGKKGLNNGVQKGNKGKKNINSPQIARVNQNSGRITKKGRINGNNQLKKNLTGKIKTLNVNQPGGRMIDARNKLVAKTRQKITDARDRLADISKKSGVDLRQKLLLKKPAEPVRKSPAFKAKPAAGVHKLVRDVGRNPITRTIISRTVSNDLARPSYSGAPPLFAPLYEAPPPPQYYDYHHPEPSYNFKQSSAAMDCEPPPSASKRIQTTEKRLGPRDEVKPKAESGFKVYVSNLHPKVTQEDIVELFGDVGSLGKAAIQRPGVAEVTYIRREDALRAVDVYNNRQLDGLPMHCSLGSTYEARRDTSAPSMKSRYSDTKYRQGQHLARY